MKPEIAQGLSFDIATASASADAAKAPEWVHLMPLGEWKGADGRGPYRLDRPNADRVVAALQAAKRPLPIDYDHALDLALGAKSGQPAPAAGWFSQAEVRDDGIWARVEWTARGSETIAAKEYRFISPVFNHDKTGRVLQLLRAGLTNTPNFESLTALASQNQTEGTADMDEFLKQLIALLGLAAGATTDQVIAAIKDLLAKGEATASQVATAAKKLGLDEKASTFTAVVDAIGKLIDTQTATASQVSTAAEALGLPKDTQLTALAAAIAAKGKDGPTIASLNSQIAVLNTQMNELKAERAGQSAEAVVASAITSGKVAPVLKDWALNYAKTDPKGFGEYLEKQPVLLDPASGAPTLAASQGEGGGLSTEEKAICSQLGLTEDAYKNSKAQIVKAVAR
jgi:phage I-like protein